MQSGSVGEQHNYTVIPVGFESASCMRRSTKRVERTCEGIDVCNAWNVYIFESLLGGYGQSTVNRSDCELNVCVVYASSR